MAKQKVEFEIEWPEDRTYRYYVAATFAGCIEGGFWRGTPDQAPCHIIIERPREVCGKRWWLGFDGTVRAPQGLPQQCIEIRCALDPGHDGPCMMELGRAE